MKLYLSGPMRGKPLFNTNGFAEAARNLRDDGQEIWSPSEMDLAEGLDPSQADSWQGDIRALMRRDIKIMLEVEGIVMLPGWQNSKGANFELAVAWYLGLSTWLYVGGEDDTKNDGYTLLICFEEPTFNMSRTEVAGEKDSSR